MGGPFEPFLTAPVRLSRPKHKTTLKYDPFSETAGHVTSGQVIAVTGIPLVILLVVQLGVSLVDVAGRRVDLRRRGHRRRGRRLDHSALAGLLHLLYFLHDLLLASG